METIQGNGSKRERPWPLCRHHSGCLAAAGSDGFCARHRSTLHIDAIVFIAVVVAVVTHLLGVWP